MQFLLSSVVTMPIFRIGRISTQMRNYPHIRIERANTVRRWEEEKFPSVASGKIGSSPSLEVEPDVPIGLL